MEKYTFESYMEIRLNFKKELEAELDSGIKLTGLESGRKLTGYEVWQIKQQIEQIEIEFE